MSILTKLKSKNLYLFIVILIIALIIFRLLLPTLVKNYVNGVLADLDGYHGSVEDIDIALIRGAYVIEGFYMFSNNAVTDIPLLNFPKNDISVEWKSLFKGEIVSEIYMNDPEVNYVVQDMAVEDTTDNDWTEILTDLVPLDINHFEVTNGQLEYIDEEDDSGIDLQINTLQFTAENLRNVIDAEQKLPSPIKGTGISVGNGNLKIDGDVNMLKKIPDADLNMSLESIDLSSLNDVFRKYGKMDFESGRVDNYTELAIADGYMEGYFKVLFNDLKFHSEEDKFLETAWEGVVQFFQLILKNKKTKQFALKAPIQGQIEDLSVKTLPTIGSILKNAFIDGIKSGVDQEINYQNVLLKEKKDSLGFFQFKKKKELNKKIEENEEAAEIRNQEKKE